MIKMLIKIIVCYMCLVTFINIKKAEHQRIDAFELWCWRRLLTVPWTAETKPVNPKGDQPWIVWKDWCRSANTLATWCKELIDWETPWCWEKLKAEEGDRGSDGWMASLIQWTSLSKCQEMVKGQGRLVCWNPWGCQELDTTWRLHNKIPIHLFFTSSCKKLVNIDLA